MDTTAAFMLISILLAAFWSSCAPEEPVGTAHIKAVFQLKSTAAMDGRIAISEAFLKLSRIEITGSLEDGNSTSFTHTFSAEEPPFRLSEADSNSVSFALPSGIYEALDFSLFLFQNDYQLAVNEVPADDTPGTPEGNNGQQQPAAGTEGDAGNTSGEDTNQDTDHDEDKGDGEQEDQDDHQGQHEDDQKDSDAKNHDEDKTHHGKDKDGKDKGKKDKGKKDDKDKHKNKNNDEENGKNDHDNRTSATGITRLVDIDDFFQNGKPGMVVIGTYSNSGKSIDLIFVAAGIERFDLRGKQNDSFSVRLEGESTAAITFDPERWFSTLSTADIESAPVQIYHGEPVLFIHPDSNTPLFRALVPGIEGSADLNFKASSF